MSKKIAVVLDSTSLESEKLMNSPHVYWIPLNIIVDGKTFEDKSEINEDELLNYLDEKREISTSQPSVQKSIEVFEEIKTKNYDHIFALSLSSHLSGTLNSFDLGISAAGIDNIDLIDTYAIAGVISHMAEVILDYNDEGKSLDEIREKLQSIIDSTETFLTVASLERLMLSGRLNKTVGNIATRLKIQILLTLKNRGESVELYEIYRKESKLKQSLLKSMERLNVTEKSHIIYILEIDALDKAKDLEELIRGAYPNIEIVYGNLPSVIASHVGRGAAGVQILEK